MTDHPMHVPDAELETQISSSHTQDQGGQREREEADNPATTAVHIPQRTYHYPTVASETESASAETRPGSTRHASPRPYFAPGISRIQSASPSGHSRSPPQSRGRSRLRHSSPGPSLPLRSSVISTIRGACICGHCRAAIHPRSVSPFRNHSAVSYCTGPRRSILGNAVENVLRDFENLYQDRSQNISYGYRSRALVRAGLSSSYPVPPAYPSSNHHFGIPSCSTSQSSSSFRTISWGQEQLEREHEISVLEACLSGRGWDALCPEFRRIYQWDVGEFHAHCTQNADCPFKSSYIEAVSQITADGKLIRFLRPGAYPAVSQAYLLGRHEQCTCPITRIAPGMPPSRPDHEKIFEQLPFDTPRVKRLHDDRFLLLDHPLRVWTVLQSPPRATYDDAQLGDLSLPSVIASGTLTPFPAGTPTPLAGITCPCYDEVHGSGAAFKAQAELASRLSAAAAATSPRSASLDTPNNNNNNNTDDVSTHPFAKARAAIARRYRAAFPWLDPVSLFAEVTQICYRLADEYEEILRGRISDDEIIAFYGSEAFAADGCHEDIERERERHADPGGGRERERDRDVFCIGTTIAALEHKYAHNYPWMSPRFVSDMAGSDARWLQCQALARGPGERLLADRQIIAFFGAEKWV